VPDTLADHIDYSQIAQAEGLKFGIEHFRRRKPHCSGALVWQMNDCWPVLSWSVMDYYGAGKAGYYYLKRVFAPVLASFRDGLDGTELWITNDTLDRIEDDVTVTLGTFAGETLETWPLVVDLPPNSSQRVQVFSPDVADNNIFLRVTSGSSRFAANRHFFADFRDLDRQPAEPAVEKRRVNDHEAEVTLTAPGDGYCWFVHLERPEPTTWYSDNYIDLAPGESQSIVVRDNTSPVLPDEITVGWR
jgi:beta-mannosidase